MIAVRYQTTDNFNCEHTFNTIAEAQAWAWHWIGRYPTIGRMHGYAVSDDGIGKITVTGISITELFPDGC